MTALNIIVDGDGALHVAGDIPPVIHIVDELIRDADGSLVSVDQDVLTFHVQSGPLTYRVTGPHPLLTGVFIAEQVTT